MEDTRTFTCAYCWHTETGSVANQLSLGPRPGACPDHPRGLGTHLWRLIPGATKETA